MEIAALILGIIGFFLAWIPGCGIFLGGIPALVGFILAIIALYKKMPRKKQAIAGLVLSILSFVAMIVSLVIIPLIGIGTSIYNSANEVVKQSDLVTDSAKSMTEQAKVMYNEPFENYKGTNVSGSQVRALCQSVRSHNLVNSSDLTKQIEVINGTASGKAASSFKSSQTSSALEVERTTETASKYTVTFGYDPDTGLITQIGIKQNDSSSSDN